MFALARYTVIETLRDRIYLGFFVGMTLLTAIFVLIGSSPWGLENYIVERLGWMTVEVLIVLQTAIYAVNNIYREYEKRILYNHLTTPLGRNGYVFGKSLGLIFMQAILAMGGATIILLGVRFVSHLGEFKWAILWLVPSVVLKAAVLLGYAFLLAQFATNALTASLFTLGVYLAGNGANEILLLTEKLGGTAQALMTAFYYVIPNLQLLDFGQASLYDGGVSFSVFLNSLLYGSSYLVIALVATCAFFRNRNL